MRCDFCFRKCEIDENETGYCQVRTVKNSKLITNVYGHVVSLAIDPIEKKPLRHFLPKTETLSLALSGCNLKCKFCQNWSISQTKPIINNDIFHPEEIVYEAYSRAIPSISYTYSEPIIWQDYVYDVSYNAQKRDIKNIMVTNGSFSKESRSRIINYIDAFSIDLKGNAKFYKEICDGDFKSVVDSIEFFVQKNKIVEVTTMLIEGIHDETDITFLGKVLSDCGVKVWHLSRFFPAYLMNDRMVSSESYLKNMIQVAKKSSIPFIYGGNTVETYLTYCDNCGEPIFSTNKGICSKCGNKIYGVFQ